jgi:hypothetical protein
MSTLFEQFREAVRSQITERSLEVEVVSACPRCGKLRRLPLDDSSCSDGHPTGEPDIAIEVAVVASSARAEKPSQRHP